MGVVFYFSDQSIKRTFITSVCGVLLVFGCSIISSQIYDWSWDGNTYHKCITGFLKYGWNPLYETFYDFAAGNFPFITYNATWCDAYPKGTETWGACIYYVFQNIEAGKSFNLIAVFALLCICYAFFKEMGILTKWQNRCCALLLILNPVVIIQCFTYYNDGFLAQMLLLCFFSLLYLTFYYSKKLRKIAWYLIFVSINIGFNTKFSATLFFAIICLSFFGYWIFLKVKQDGFNKNTILFFRNSFYILAGSVLSGTLLIGATSYVINVIRHKNPFYTMIGAGSTEMITSQMPVVFKDMSNVGRFCASFFSRTNRSKSIETIEWKMPLTFDHEELLAMWGVDTRTAGWGVFFSGIFLISIAVIFFVMIKDYNLSSRIKQLTVILFVILASAIVVIPGLSWARYCVVLFWVPVAALVLIFINLNKKIFQKDILSFVAEVLIVLLCLNMLPCVTYSCTLWRSSVNTHDELERFKVISDNNEITVYKPANGGFFGYFFNLYDIGVNNFVYGFVDSQNCSGKLFEQYSLIYDVTDGLLSKINLEDFLDCYSEQENYLLLIAVKDEGSKALTTEIIAKFQQLGLKFDLQNHYRWAYLALLDGDKVIYENISDEQINFNDNVDGVHISMLSAGYEKGNVASIAVDGNEYALNKRGLNIVVYDKAADCMIDSICVDTYADNKLTRKQS